MIGREGSLGPQELLHSGVDYTPTLWVSADLLSLQACCSSICRGICCINVAFVDL
jgi:hypothetical protein